MAPGSNIRGTIGATREDVRFGKVARWWQILQGPLCDEPSSRKRADLNRDLIDSQYELRLILSPGVYIEMGIA